MRLGLVLTILSIGYSTQTLAAWRCGSNVTQTSCEQDGCVWNEAGEKSSCLSKTISSCSSATSENSCYDLGCAWDQENKCFEIGLCEKATSDSSCTYAGCTWAPEQNKCVQNPGKMFCITSKDKASCDSAFLKRCVWQDVDNKCLNTFRIGGSSCDESLQESTCNRIAGCLWDEDGNRCLDNGLWKSANCQERRSKDACDAYKRKCRWDEESGCIGKDQCLFAKSENSCQKSLGCFWEPNRKICLQDIDNSCAFVGEQICTSRFKNSCQWSDRFDVCIAKSLEIQSIKQTMPSDLLKNLTEWTEQNGINLRHAFNQYDDDRCRYYDKRETCNSTKQCIWEISHKFCFEKHTVLCEYLRKDSCTNVNHCIWDDGAKICLFENVPCAFVKDQGLCTSLKACRWDDRNYCENK